jgi:hypothetical protein
MTKNHRDQDHEGFSGGRSNHKPYDDYNILEPSADIDLNFLQEDDDDELSDYTLMDNAVDPDYED